MSHGRGSTAGTGVFCPVSAVAEAVAAARAGARIVDAGDDEALVNAIQEAGVDVLVCGPGAAADVGREPAARHAGQRLLICADVAAADRAVQAGTRRDRVVVQVTAGELEAAVRAGWRTMVDADAGLSGQPPVQAAARAGAVAAVSAWLGASLVRTRHVAEVRRCLDMTESIIGRRPPAWAVRGLG